MRKVAILFALVFFSGPLLASDFPSEWLVCEQNSDCIKTTGICNTHETINKNFKKEYGRFVLKSERCETRPAVNLKTKAKCIDGQCTLMTSEKRK